MRSQRRIEEVINRRLRRPIEPGELCAVVASAGELRRPARHARFGAARSAASWPAAAGAVLRRNTISRQLPDESWTLPVIPFRGPAGRLPR